jgi:endo-1,4-beta-xylanase
MSDRIRLQKQSFVRRAVTLAVLSLPLGLPSLTQAQTTVNGSAFAYRSTGTVSGTDVVLTSNGYVGTYVTTTAATSVTLAVRASGTADSGIAPTLQLAVDDTVREFITSPTPTGYSATVTLPAGTHFVRAAYSNDAGSATRALTISNLQVTGASVLNSATNANALAAADTYAANFRRGSANVTVVGAAPGTSVEFKLKRNNFNFTGSVTGTSLSDSTAYLTVANPAAGSNAANYQKYFGQNFNTLVPSNGGKWSYNEPTQNNIQMGYVDALASYAASHNLDMRQHNLIWGNQQPTWVNTLLTNAQSSNPTTAAAAKTALINAIANRITYYVGGTAKRANQYIEMDILNEALRTGPYWQILGNSGVAAIYNQAATAAAAAGNPGLRLYTNEYNVLAFSTNPSTSASDPYANWYRQNVEDLRAAVVGPTVSGIGIQYYADSSLSNHSASRIMSVMQNMAITRVPVSLTEFNINSAATSADASQILNETLRMMYGSPDATTFGLWGFWAGASSGTFTDASLYDVNWNLTPVGLAYQSLLAQWGTDVTTLVGANGLANFNGTFGDYDVLINGQAYPLTLVKGTQNYSIVVPEPAGFLSLVPAFAATLLTRRRR